MSNSTTAKRGRPRKADSLQFRTVGLTQEQWDWLELWFPGGNPTTQLAELFERSQKFWPSGPGAFR